MELVVLREHEGVAPDFIRDAPKGLPLEVPCPINIQCQHVSDGFHERRDVCDARSHGLGEEVEDRARYAIDSTGSVDGASGGVALPNGLETLFGGAIRRNRPPGGKVKREAGFCSDSGTSRSAHR